MLPFTASKALKVATSQEGVKESPPGSNRQKYGAAFRMNGEAWCGIFVWWVFLQCGVDLRKLLDCAGTQLASVLAFEKAAIKAGWKWHHGHGGMLPGDLAVIDRHPNDGMRDHIHMVITAGSTAYKAVGGNQGDHVSVITNVYSGVVGYLRPPYKPEKRPQGDKRRTHVVGKGENLSKIAAAYYRDAARWPEIYRANRQVIGSDPNIIRPGVRLVIP